MHRQSHWQLNSRGIQRCAGVALIGATVCASSLLTPAYAAPTPYWECVSPKGIRGAQDRPCDPSYQTLRAPPGTPSIPVAPAINPVGNGLADHRPQLNQAQPRLPAPPSVNPLKPADVFKPVTGMALKVAGIAIAASLLLLAAVAIARRRGSSATGPEEKDSVRTEPTFLSAPTRPASVPAVLSEINWAASAVPVNEAPPQAWDMKLLRTLEWKRFEELCERFWSLKGYKARLSGAGADGGVDVIISDPRNPESIFAVAQCKSWVNKPVGVETVRALWGSKDHFNATLALFYGLSGFTDDAHAFAKGKHLKLVSGDGLLQQIKSLPESDQDVLLSFVTRGDYATPTCPACDTKMVLRTGREGKADFWGCPKFRICGSHPISLRPEA